MSFEEGPGPEKRFRYESCQYHRDESLQPGPSGLASSSSFHPLPSNTSLVGASAAQTTHERSPEPIQQASYESYHDHQDGSSEQPSTWVTFSFLESIQASESSIGGSSNQRTHETLGRIFAVSQPDVESDDTTGDMDLYQLLPKTPDDQPIKYTFPLQQIGGALVRKDSWIFWVGGLCENISEECFWSINAFYDYPLVIRTYIRIIPQRYLHTATAHQNSIYIMGGIKVRGRGAKTQIEAERYNLRTGMCSDVSMLKSYQGPVSLLSCKEYLVTIKKGNASNEDEDEDKIKLKMEKFELIHQGVEVEGLPHPIPHRHAAVSIGYDVYIIGGKSTPRFITRYNVEENEWYEVTASAPPRWNCSACCYHGNIIIAGGYGHPQWAPSQQLGIARFFEPRVEYMESVLSYNPQTQEISTIANLTTRGLYQNSMVVV